MSEIFEATLEDGSVIPYVVKDNPPRGGMKYTYFSPDKSYVVQFFNDPAVGRDINIQNRIAAIIGKYNPTVPEDKGGAKGNTGKLAAYFSDKYCWPTAIVKYPEFGVVCPAYPSNYFFDEKSSIVDGLDLKGKDKKSNWFTSRNRKYLSPDELGNFLMMMKISISLARSIRRMHAAGLAHSDLSNNNVLIDPKSGSCVVIDIDSLVVPGLYPPEVAGTRGYIAPEVLETTIYPFGDSRRKLPCIETDLHSMAVLIYEYLLTRHPLNGPKHIPNIPVEEEDFLLMGSEAIFIEDPNDRSNRPDDLKITIHDLGPHLEKLFIRAFSDGLHAPEKRPTAIEWENALTRTWDMMYPCDNPQCSAKWFVMHDPKNPVCPFCGRKIAYPDVAVLNSKKRINGKSGQWVDAGRLVLYNNMPVFQWHIYSNVFPDEKAERDMQAYIARYEGQWFLVNQRVQDMKSSGGNTVPPGKAILLKDGVSFMASEKQNGYLMEVSIIRH